MSSPSYNSIGLPKFILFDRPGGRQNDRAAKSLVTSARCQAVPLPTPQVPQGARHRSGERLSGVVSQRTEASNFKGASFEALKRVRYSITSSARVSMLSCAMGRSIGPP
jgi:hypothetical protein